MDDFASMLMALLQGSADPSAARLAALRGQPMAPPPPLPGAQPQGMPQPSEADQRDQAFGLLGQLTGDRVLSPFGKSLAAAPLERQNLRAGSMKQAMEEAAYKKQQGDEARNAGPVNPLSKFLGQGIAPGIPLDGIDQETFDRSAPLLEKFQLGKLLAQSRAKKAGAAGPSPTDLTPEGLDQLAEQFATSGTLPALGQGKEAAAMKAKIVNRAAALHAGGNLAGNKADYHANTASLGHLQTQADTIEAFERTGLANLDTALSTFKGLADTGSPLVNRPLRWLAGHAGGDPAVARAHAAMATARSEISKVLSGATGAGAPSDAAQNEVKALLGDDMTMAQATAAADILRQDMANRRREYRGQIGEVRKRASGGGAAAKRLKFNPATGELE